jgi:hypothetical protein
MGRRACSFRQTDLVRAIKAAKAAGVEVARIEIGRDGTLVMVMHSGATVEPVKGEIEDWLAKHNAR